MNLLNIVIQYIYNKLYCSTKFIDMVRMQLPEKYKTNYDLNAHPITKQPKALHHTVFHLL